MKLEKFLLLILILLYVPFISAETFGYNYLEEGTNLNPSINYSTLNVNNSQFLNGQIAGQLNVNSADLWDALDSPADILTSLLNNDAGWITTQEGLINSSSWRLTGNRIDTRGNYNLNVSNVLYVNGTSGKVGIGTTSPEAKLDVQSSNTNTAKFINTAALSSSAGAGIIGYTLNLPTATDQRLGFFLFGSRNGVSSNYNSAGMAGFAEGAWTAGSSYPSYLTLETTPSGSVTRQERVRITNTGNVGIGTTSPTYKLQVAGNASINNSFFVNSNGNVGIGTTNPSVKLHVSGSDNTQIVTESGGTGWFGMKSRPAASGDGMLYWNSGNSLRFGITTNVDGATDWSEKVRITTDGNVGIGTTSPVLGKLQINGSTNGFGLYVESNISADDYFYHSPFPKDDYTGKQALNDLIKIKGNNGKINHSSVPSNAMSILEKPIYETIITEEERTKKVSLEENYTYNEEICDYVEKLKDIYSYVCYNETKQGTRTKQDCSIEIKYNYVQIENTTNFEKVPYEEQVCENILVNETYIENVTTQNQIGTEPEEQTSIGMMLGNIIKSIQELFNWNIEQDSRITKMEETLCKDGHIEYC